MSVLDDINANIIAAGESAKEAADGFKKMQIALLIFCAVAAIGILLIGYKTFKEE